MYLLLVEDTKRLAASLSRGLREEGMSVTAVGTGADATAEIASRAPDLIILDLGLPDLDGIDVLVRSRAGGYRGPILVLSARDAVESRVAALDAGADDYVTKPFVFDELCARVRALARRASTTPWAPLACGDVRVEQSAVTVAGKRVRMSPTERTLLACLLRRQGSEVTRREILSEVFGYDFDPGTNVIDVHVAHLRQKLSGATVVIETVRGVGYRLVPA